MVVKYAQMGGCQITRIEVLGVEGSGNRTSWNREVTGNGVRMVQEHGNFPEIVLE